jgi:uncharacterized membrane protein YphA (DoxX/SURF4 family)
MKRLLPLVALAARIALGAVFVVAAVPKIIDPPSFAHMMANYRILPPPAVNPFALLLPWLELFTGLALVSGVFGKTATKLAAVLLVVFIGAIGTNLARDRAVQCGCFDVHAAEKSHGDLIAEMRWVVARDLGLLLLAGVAAVFPQRPLRGASTLRESPPEER